ncbi:MAG: restriction endonuclease subunit S [Ignavibacteria bacterium]|nr:restriction endonuclease subunit S [Ignavibacteria bacterium]
MEQLIWPTKRLSTLAEFRNGVNYNKSSFGGVKVVGVSNFQNYSIPRYAELDQINPDGIVTERNILRDGDIVFVRSNGNRELIGRSLFIEKPPDEITHSAFTIRLRFTSRDVYPKFYAHYFRTQFVRQSLTAQGGGTNINNLNQDILNALEVPLPPLPVQKHIAGILSAYDDLIENCQRRIRILESMARSLYREWFIHFRFPGHESHRRVASPLGEIPEGWEVKPFSAIASYINGYPFKPAQLGHEGKPVVKIKELKAGVVADTPRNLGYEIPKKYTIHDGDVLFSWSADLDAYLWMGGEGLLNQHLFNVLPFDGISHAYCYHSLKEMMPRFRALSLGATMHHIKRSALDQVFTVLPFIKPEAAL